MIGAAQSATRKRARSARPRLRALDRARAAAAAMRSRPRPVAAGYSLSTASSRQPVPVPRSRMRSGAARSGKASSAASTRASESARGMRVAGETAKRRDQNSAKPSRWATGAWSSRRRRRSMKAWAAAGFARTRSNGPGERRRPVGERRSAQRPARPRRRGIVPGQGGGGGDAVQAEAGGGGEFAQRRQQQAAGAGAEVEDAAHGAGLREGLDRRLDQGFGIGAGDEGGGGDGEGAATRTPASPSRCATGSWPEPAAQQRGEVAGGVGGTAARGSRSRSSCRQARAWASRMPGFLARAFDGGGAQVLAGAAEEEADGAGGVGAGGGAQSWSAASRAASSSWVSASMISSKSPSITCSILCRVRPMRWSVTRPCGKL